MKSTIAAFALAALVASFPHAEAADKTILSVAPSSKPHAAQRLEVATSVGVTVVASRYALAEGAKGTVVMVVTGEGDRWSMEPLALRWNRRGYHAILVDAPGFAESTGGVAGKAREWPLQPSKTNLAWSATAMGEFMQHPMVATSDAGSRFALGLGWGADVVLMTAAQSPTAMQGFVALAAGTLSELPQSLSVPFVASLDQVPTEGLTEVGEKQFLIPTRKGDQPAAQDLAWFDDIATPAILDGFTRR